MAERICSIDGCGRPLTSSARRGWCGRHYEQWRRENPELSRRPTLDARFWSKVLKTDGCWLWMAGRFSTGYGNFSVHGRPGMAHRFAYELLVGPIPEGLELDHLCRLRHCVNPEHLEPVTHWVNLSRGLAWDKTRPHNHRGKTHCKNGHPLSGDNLYLWRGIRLCRACRKVTWQKYTRSTEEAGDRGVS